MTADKRRPTSEGLYLALLNSQRDVGDVALCEALDLLAEGTGQNCFRHAASVIRGRALGRLRIDDKAALRKIAEYPASRRREAVGIVAKQIAEADASDKQVDAIAHRLRRKLRENQTDKLAVSVSQVL